MKIAISSIGKSLDSQIDHRFGRCAYFIICETEDMSFEAFANENLSLAGGAGIQSAQFVAGKGAKAVLTGNCGPNAVNTLTAAGIDLFAGQSGTVMEVIGRYKNNELKPVREANVSDHYGMKGNVNRSQAQYRGAGIGQSSSRGIGMGKGAGMGRGMRKGMGLGRGRGM